MIAIQLGKRTSRGTSKFQAFDESVLYVELVKEEFNLGKCEVWDVTTDQERWWVIANPTNLYAQKHFPSLDYTPSFQRVS